MEIKFKTTVPQGTPSGQSLADTLAGNLAKVSERSTARPLQRLWVVENKAATPIYMSIVVLANQHREFMDYLESNETGFPWRKYTYIIDFRAPKGTMVLEGNQILMSPDMEEQLPA